MCKWVITDDFLSVDEQATQEGRGNFRGDPQTLPYRFRLYDDDGELYYGGRSNDRLSELAFRPLDWAESDSGCTRIDYLQDDGRWETL